AVGLAAGQRLGEVQRLLGVDFAGHGRLERIDDGLDDGGAGRGESIVEHAAAIGGIVDGESGAAAGVGEGGEVNGIKLASVFRIAEKNHLLPLDLAEGVVLDDDHFDGQPIFNCSNEIGHQHGETAVAYEGHYLPAGIGD